MCASEIETILWLTVLTCLILALCLFLIAYGKNYKGLIIWANGLLLICIVNPIVMQKALLPSILWIHISSISIMAGYLCMYSALCALHDKKPSVRLLVMAMAFTILIAIYTFDNPSYRMIINSGLYIFILGAILRSAIPDDKRIPGRGGYIFMAALTIQLTAYIYCILFVMDHPDMAARSLSEEQSWLIPGFYLVLMSTTIIYTFGLIFMVLESSANKIQELLNMDPLTGVWNRRKLDQLGTNKSLKKNALIMADIDYFKNINDQRGHLFGDTILSQFASRLNKDLRRTDILFRWGGEEFLIILSETTYSEAGEIAERLRKNIEHGEFESSIQVTASFGYTVFIADEPLADTLARADRALYYAKDSGRNRAIGIDPR